MDFGMPPSAARYADIDTELAGQRLDNFLLGRLKGVPRSHVYRLIRSGQVRVNSGRVRPHYRLKAGDRVRIPPVKQGADNPTAGGLEAPRWLEERVLFEDERVIALDKPSGMAVHGGSGVSFGVIEALRALRPKERHLQLAHRLDRGTSGCLLIAKRRSALRPLHELLREGGVEKRYLALVRGQWHHGEKKINVPLRTDTRQNGERHVVVAEDGKVAVSRFRAVDFFDDASMIEALIETGRTHQIRVHGTHMDHPVAGDSRYGDPVFNARMLELGLKRLFLHASSLSLDWPDGSSLNVSAPLPEDLAQVLTRLSGAPREPKSRSGGPGHRSRSGPWRRRPKSAGGR
jgi:23S rRNA pseudouridine955/2504/2580 synthase